MHKLSWLKRYFYENAFRSPTINRACLFMSLSCLFFTGRGQEYKYVYYLGPDLSSTTFENAVFVAKGLSDSGLFRLDYFNKVTGKRIMSAHYIDSSLQNMQGSFQSFYTNGNTENEGAYVNGQEEGVWIKWDSAGQKTDSLIYHNGKKLGYAAYRYLKGKISSYEFTDSVNDKYRYTDYNEDGIHFDAEFTGNNGILKTYDSGKVRTREVSSRKLKEAEFPGGPYGYQRFLSSNLNPLVPSDHGAPSGTYTVIIKFDVEKDGTVNNLSAETHFGYGMEAEALKTIGRSPKWIPAELFGMPVVALRRQPITFLIDNGDLPDKRH